MRFQIALLFAVALPLGFPQQGRCQSMREMEHPTSVTMGRWLHDLSVADDARVRCEAAIMLGRNQVASAYDSLLMALNHDGSVPVQRAAAWALGQIGDPRAVPSLLGVYRSAGMVSDAARQALRHMADTGVTEATAALKANDEQRTKRLLAELSAPPATGQVQACEALRAEGDTCNVLGKIAGGRAVEALSICLRSDSVEVRTAAMETLGKIADKRSAAPVASCLTDPSPVVRREAVKVLGDLGDSGVADAVMMALADGDAIVRARTAETLGKLGAAQANDRLLVVLGDSDGQVRAAAATALGQLQATQAVQPLSKHLLDDKEREEVRIAACSAVTQLGGESIRELLFNTMTRATGRLRIVAALSLGRFRDLRAIEPLTAIVRNQRGDGKDRCEAAQCLGQYKTDQVIWPLAAVLRDQDTHVAIVAAKALADVGDERVMTPLTAAERDPRPEIQDACRQAIHQIHEKRMGQ